MRAGDYQQGCTGGYGIIPAELNPFANTQMKSTIIRARSRLENVIVQRKYFINDNNPLQTICRPKNVLGLGFSRIAAFGFIAMPWRAQAQIFAGPESQTVLNSFTAPFGVTTFDATNYQMAL